MSLKNALSGSFSLIGMLVLILDSRCAMYAAADGITLCLKTVIPSLFPFLFLTRVLTDSLWGSSLPVFRPLTRRLGIPAGADSLLMVSLLGGYPAGAIAVADSYREGKLTREDAGHLLTFCSNAGPGFLFGMAAVFFPDRQDLIALWIILILSSFMTGCLTGKAPAKPAELAAKRVSIPQILSSTSKTMGLICGWIILFRILAQFLTRWILWRFPVSARVVITGLLELTNGCMDLGMIQVFPLRFVICGCLLSFGGFCVLLQTASLLGTLPLFPYIAGKVTQTAFTLLLCILYLLTGFGGLVLAAVIFLICSGKVKKPVDFGIHSVYNDAIITWRKGYAVSQKN